MHAPENPPPTGENLRAALAGLLDGLPPRQAAQAVERLIANYRGRTPTDAPVLRDRSDVAAYAAYRMPATFEAVRSALAAFRGRLPDWTPASHVDIGGGTGAATWAVAAAWPDDERTTTVLDWAEPALALGGELARSAASPALRAARWRRQAIGAGLEIPEGTDLVTVSYVLGELTPADRAAVVAQAARARGALIVEPGTPEGYLRIIEARERLIEAGFTVVAPCPHNAACPIVPGTDWCHFSARVSRSSLHRQVKGGSLAYEDEKFSYVAAVRQDVPGDVPGDGAPARVVRRPQIRKGQVLLDLCTPEDGLTRETVTKRHGALYRAARDTGWGDAWPPAED
ncbi:rRNA methyltransferase [Streptomyces sp. AV19]|uniref:small ribosomal subunit Rsm22 family protein n=1 Tax=Streptomyces sp. AV19 TaxID=2793068 RepID=UPI0018FE4551|nr:small ribosomal subunit Rsm22 family protein [Streptomyces sp. AV19]MBH1933428.1 rRNA methyltransferase [Streptomyces sp. AV19]MDG4532077.1 small ribosomal subunit Rsm22 family protein [Streptomyces sp. AV19]